MISTIRLVSSLGSRRASGTAPTITAGMDSFERPLAPPGQSAGEQARRRPSRVARRLSFDGNLEHLQEPLETNHVWASPRQQTPQPAQRHQAAMPRTFVPNRLQTPVQRPALFPATSATRTGVPQFHDRRTRLVEVAAFAGEIDQLESRLRTQMGWLAIDGVRNLSSVSMGLASVIGLVFSVVALTASHLLPGLGIIIFASLVVGGIVVGVLAQTLARWLWARRNDTAPLRAELVDIRARLLRQAADGRIENLLDSEIRQLRRLERLEVRLDGGFFNTLGDALIGTFGWDPRLGDMLGRAAKNRKEAARRHAEAAAARATPRPAPAQPAASRPAVRPSAPRPATAVRRPAAPQRAATARPALVSASRRPTAAAGTKPPSIASKKLRWATNVIRAAQPKPNPSTRN